MFQVDLEEFIIRSFKLYIQYEEIPQKSEDYSVTLAINLLLGILIQPRGKWHSNFEKMSFEKDSLMYNTVKKGHENIENLNEYLTALRNGFVHREECGKDKLIFEGDGKIEILHLETSIGEKKSKKEIEIEIKIDELKPLLGEIARIYLEFFDKKYKEEMKNVLEIWHGLPDQKKLKMNHINVSTI